MLKCHRVLQEHGEEMLWERDESGESHQGKFSVRVNQSGAGAADSLSFEIMAAFDVMS